MAAYVQYQHPYASAYASRYPYQQQYVQQPQYQSQQQYQQAQAAAAQQQAAAQQAAAQQAYYQQQQQQQAQALNFPTFAGSTPGPASAAQLPRTSSTRPHTPGPNRKHSTSGNHHHHSSSGHRPSTSSQQYNGQLAPSASISGQPQQKRASLRRRPAVSGITNAAAVPPIQTVPSITRARTYSGGTDRPRLGSIRSRTNSSAARELPTMMSHIFLSVKAPDLLEVNNVVHPDLLTKISNVLRVWHRNVDFQRTDYDLLAKFYGRPFSTPVIGPEGIDVQKMLCALFKLFGDEGYVSLTSVHCGSGFAAPRLVFVRNAPDVTCNFFSMALNEGGVIFVDAPRQLIENLNLTLNGVFRKAFFDEEIAPNVFAIRRRPGNQVNKDHFYAVLLKYFNDECLKLDASISLGRTGFFGLGPRQEIWIFKGSELWQRGGEKR